MLSLADLRRPRAFFAYRRAAAINRAAFRRSRFSSESLNSASAVMYRVTCISNADNTSDPSDAELGTVAAIDDHPRYVVLGPS